MKPSRKTDRPSRPSKTQQKKGMLERQRLGEKLMQLSPAQLAGIEMPEDLREAIDDARKMTKHGALTRQRQFIGKLMREVDPAPLQQALDHVLAPGRLETKRLHEAERWRDRLIADIDGAVQDFVTAYPACDRGHLRRLIRQARKETAEGKAPAAAREIFRYVKSLF